MEYIISNTISPPHQIAARIDRIRQERGLTQQQLAQTLNISQPAVSKYLSDRLPPADVLFRLAQLGETSMEWILTGKHNSSATGVGEEKRTYGSDPELRLATHISTLPAPVKQALITLIKALAQRM